MKANIHLRQAIEPDASFIFSSWLKSFRHSRLAGNVASSIYFTEHHKIIESLLTQCKTLVACNPEDKNQIFGYLCYEEIDGILVIHYVYTKHTFRKMGIAECLINEVREDDSVACMFTHCTNSGERIAPKFKCVYHPYLSLTPEYRSKYKLDEIEEVNEEKAE